MDEAIKTAPKDIVSIFKEFQIEPCSDIVCGKNGKFWFSENERKKMNKTDLEIKPIGKDNKVITVVIILESPHKEEFKGFKYANGEEQKISPALGKTGDKLQKHFNKEFMKKMLKKMGKKEDDDYRVILMNSIQYQCSLGYRPKMFRDYIWLKLWFDCSCIKKDFIKRLISYKPDMIFNFCTKGDHTEQSNLPPGCKTKINKKYLEHCLKRKLYKANTLQEYVDKEINCKIKKKNLFKRNGPHPASWIRSDFDLEKHLN